MLGAGRGAIPRGLAFRQVADGLHLRTASAESGAQDMDLTYGFASVVVDLSQDPPDPTAAISGGSRARFQKRSYVFVFAWDRFETTLTDDLKHRQFRQHRNTCQWPALGQDFQPMPVTILERTNHTLSLEMVLTESAPYSLMLSNLVNPARPGRALWSVVTYQKPVPPPVTGEDWFTAAHSRDRSENFVGPTLPDCREPSLCSIRCLRNVSATQAGEPPGLRRASLKRHIRKAREIPVVYISPRPTTYNRLDIDPVHAALTNAYFDMDATEVMIIMITMTIIVLVIMITIMIV